MKRPERKKKTRPEWIGEVEDIRYDRGVAREQLQLQQAETSKRPPRRIFSHLKYLVNQHIDINERAAYSDGATAGSGETLESSSALNALIQQQYDASLVTSYCQAYELLNSAPVSLHAAPPTSSSIYGGATSPPTCEVSALSPIHPSTLRLCSLQVSCLESISDNFEHYATEDICQVLSLLPPVHCSVLSAMCCRKNKLTDENIFVFFSQQHVSTLFLGGTRVTDRFLDKTSPLPPPSSSFSSLKLVPPDCWEDLCDSSSSSRSVDLTLDNSSTALDKLVILSPNISTEGLARIISSPFSNHLRAISVHGKCSSVVSANCACVLTESINTSGVVQAQCPSSSMGHAAVTSCFVRHLKNTLGWQ